MAKKKNKKRKRNNHMNVLLIVLLVITILCFVHYNKNKLVLDYDKELTVNINDELYNTDIIKNNNGKIITEKEKVDTSKIGEQIVTIEIEDNFGNKKGYSSKVIVIDSEAPVLTYNTSITTTVGVKVDLLEGVSASDNSNEEIAVKIEGKYDFNKVGTYILHYSASDSSGNRVSKEFSLIVNEKKEKTNNKETTRTFITSKGFKGEIIDGITYIDGYLVANKTYSLPKDYNPGLLDITKTNANKMFTDASKEGLNIYISSGFRSYTRQETLYNNYVKSDGKEKADTYSARPGYSEHQSGLAFDVNQINSTFDNTPEAKWLHKNCYKYGFILRYPEGKTNETGYIYESWHYRYVGVELATKLYNDGDWITMEDYFGITSSYE